MAAPDELSPTEIEYIKSLLHHGMAIEGVTSDQMAELAADRIGSDLLRALQVVASRVYGHEVKRDLAEIEEAGMYALEPDPDDGLEELL